MKVKLERVSWYKDLPFFVIEVTIKVSHGEQSWRCGYVGVPKDHPLFGEDYNKPNVEVHGGLTYAAGESVISDLLPGYWWFGFDCNHADDFINPKTLSYATLEAYSLAAQLEQLK